MRLEKIFHTDDSARQLILRLALGFVMFPHGAQKMLGWFGGEGFSATIGLFGAHGMPAAIAFLVIIGEFFGSLGMITGLLTRVSAGGVVAIMLGAIGLVHAPNGFFMNWQGHQKGEGFEYHLLVVGMALVLVVFGGGRYSLDAVIARRLAARGRKGTHEHAEARS